VLLWTILQLLAAAFCVLLPFILQARESLHPPMNPPSLGTFGIVMMAALYFTLTGLVNGFVTALRAGWPWYAGLGVGVLAAAAGAVGSYWLLYWMASKGGTTVTLVGGLGLTLLLAANILGPRLV
jgi:hypothetical protein